MTTTLSPAVPSKRASAGQDRPMNGALVKASRRRWLIEIAPGDIHLVGSRTELSHLLRRRPVTGETRVYEVGAGPRALRDIPELARLLPQGEDSEPPIRPRPVPEETRSPERVKLSEELAVLNRPLEGEIEYYDVPGSRAKRMFAAVMVLAVLGGAGSLLMAQRSRGGNETASVTAKAPAAEPAATPAPVAPAAPVAPIAPRPATEAARRPFAEPRDPEPDGDPPLPSAAARHERPARGR